MSENKTRSAIDEIYAISERLDTLEKYLIVIDNNVKILNNKVSKITRKSDDSSPLNQQTVASENVPTASAMAVKAGPSAIPAKSKELIIGDIKLFGYIYSKAESPIKGVNVIVYNSVGEIIKEKVTDSEGYWSARLPSGKYGVEYNYQFGKRKFKPINRTVELNDNIKEFEVT